MIHAEPNRNPQVTGNVYSLFISIPHNKTKRSPADLVVTNAGALHPSIPHRGFKEGLPSWSDMLFFPIITIVLA